MRLIAVLLLAVAGALLVPVPASATPHQIMIMNFTLSPATITVRAGDTITWTNHDEAPHDVASSSGPAAFRSPLLERGQSWTATFTAAGDYAYYCSVHPDMRARIVVLAAETPAAPAPANPPPVQRQPVTQRPAATTTVAPAPAPAAPVEQQPGPAQEVRAAQVTGERLDPMLIVAGIVGAVAILCLLLLGARPDT